MIPPWLFFKYIFSFPFRLCCWGRKIFCNKLYLMKGALACVLYVLNLVIIIIIIIIVQGHQHTSQSTFGLSNGENATSLEQLKQTWKILIHLKNYGFVLNLLCSKIDTKPKKVKTLNTEIILRHVYVFPWVLSLNKWPV